MRNYRYLTFGDREKIETEYTAGGRPADIAIGSRRSGSNCFLIARYNKTKDTRSITHCCQVIAAKPDWASSSAKTESIFKIGRAHV